MKIIQLDTLQYKLDIKVMDECEKCTKNVSLTKKFLCFDAPKKFEWNSFAVGYFDHVWRISLQ